MNTAFVKGILVVTALLHLLFAGLELFPPSYPRLLALVSAGLPRMATGVGERNDVDRHDHGAPQQCTEPQRRLVAAVVQNAGIYNVVFAAGLLWVLWSGDVLASAPRAVAQTLFAGAALAGVFGTATLPAASCSGVMGGLPTALQAMFGITGFVIMTRAS
jgi:hypothetical protein